MFHYFRLLRLVFRNSTAQSGDNVSLHRHAIIDTDHDAHQVFNPEPFLTDQAKDSEKSGFFCFNQILFNEVKSQSPFSGLPSP
jgi:hypothetical protein